MLSLRKLATVLELLMLLRRLRRVKLLNRVTLLILLGHSNVPPVVLQRCQTVVRKDIVRWDLNEEPQELKAQ